MTHLRCLLLPFFLALTLTHVRGNPQTLCNGQLYNLTATACVNNQLRPIIKCPDLHTTAAGVYRYALIMDNYLLVNSGLTRDQLVAKYNLYFHDVELFYKLNYNIIFQRIYTYVETSTSFSSSINGTLLDQFGAALRDFKFGANMPRDATQYVLLTGRGWPSDGVIGLTYESSICNSVFSGGDNYNYIYDIDASDSADKVIRIAIHELSHSVGGDHPDQYPSNQFSCEVQEPGDSNSDDRIMRRSVQESPSSPSPLGYYYLQDTRYISDCASMAMRAQMHEFNCLWSAPAQNSVILYNQPNYSGDSYEAELRYSVTDCVDVVAHFNDEAQSFRFAANNTVKFSAIRFWSELECSGDSIVIQATQSADLGSFGTSISSFDIIYFEGSTCPSLSSASASSSSTASSGHAISTTSGSSSSGSTTSVTGSSGACSVAIRQTLTNTWQSGTQTYSQYEATYSNNAASGLSQVSVRLSGGTIDQIWGVVKQADGSYSLPAYTNGIAAGATFTWGYVIIASKPATISVIFPLCQAPALSSTTAHPASTSGSSSSSSASTTSTGISSGSCSASVTQSIASTWSTGGQVAITIQNTGTRAITSIQFSFHYPASTTLQQIWNADQQKNGAYAPAAWALPLAVGASVNSIGYTFAGSASMTVALASVSC